MWQFQSKSQSSLTQPSQASLLLLPGMSKNCDTRAGASSATRTYIVCVALCGTTPSLIARARIACVYTSSSFRQYGRTLWLLRGQVPKMRGKCPMSDCNFMLCMYIQLDHVGGLTPSTASERSSSSDWSELSAAWLAPLPKKPNTLVRRFDGEIEPLWKVCYGGRKKWDRNDTEVQPNSIFLD